MTPSEAAEVDRRLRSVVEATGPWPNLDGVVLVDRGDGVTQLRWWADGNVHVASTTAVALRRRDGVLEAVPVDDPPPDFDQIVPAGVVREVSRDVGSIDWIFHDDPVSP